MAYLLVALVLSTVVIIKCFVNYIKLRQFRGPWLAAVSDLWLFRQTISGTMQLGIAETIQAYGSVVRIGPNVLVTDDPVILRHMSAPRSNFIRGEWYKAMKLDPRINNVFSERDEKRHNELRAKLNGAYSGKDLPLLEPNFDSRVIDFMRLIRTKYLNKTVDFATVTQYLTMDALTENAFGAPFGYLERDEDIYEYLKMTGAFLPIVAIGCNIPLVNNILNSRIMQAIAGPSAKDKVGMGAVLGVAQKVVESRYQPDAKFEKDMLGSFIAHGLTQQEAESESVIQILGGADSTATAIRCTFLYILSNPAVYSKLQAEIDEGVRSGNISSPVVKDKEAAKLPYLQACIKEGLRMWPPLTGLLCKRAPPQGEVINGIFFPGNVDVAWSPTMVQRNKEIYGEDVWTYTPERWLTEDEEKRSKMERTVELVFGNGKYTCLGRNIAMMELNKVFVELLRNFNWGIVNPLSPMKSFCASIYVQSDMFLKPTPRT